MCNPVGVSFVLAAAEVPDPQNLNDEIIEAKIWLLGKQS